MAATIKDIAKRLNISTSTVSYALNGGPRNVPEEVRLRVLSAAKELGYRPSRIARSMITGRTNTIGVVPTETSIHLAISPYFQYVLNGILNAAEHIHHDVLVFTGYDQKNVDELADTLLDGRVDGLIFLAPPKDNPIFEQLIKRNIPMVVTSSPSVYGIPSFTCDNHSGVRQAVQHLVDLGHRRIGMLYGKIWLHEGQGRLDSFRAEMDRHGLEIRDAWLLDGDFTRLGGEECAYRMLATEDRPTALFCANDEMAIGFCTAARRSGLQLPRDMSLIGFDDSPISGLIDPALTTVQQPLEAIGASALHAINALVAGRSVQSETFSTRLVVRASAIRPLEDIKS